MKNVIDLSKYKLIPLTKLVKADWNYKEKEHDFEKLKESLRENIKRNGQIENIIVRKIEKGKYEVINGNHRYDVLKEMGVKEVICCDLGKIPLSLAKRIAIETNEVKFEADRIKLAKLIKELSGNTSIEDLAKSTPFTQSELESLIKLTEFDWEEMLKKESTNENTQQPLSSPHNPSSPLLIPYNLHLDFKTIDLFNQQIERVKLLLFNDGKKEATNIILLAVQLMLEFFASTPNSSIKAFHEQTIRNIK